MLEDSACWQESERGEMKYETDEVRNVVNLVEVILVPVL